VLHVVSSEPDDIVLTLDEFLDDLVFLLIFDRGEVSSPLLADVAS